METVHRSVGKLKWHEMHVQIMRSRAKRGIYVSNKNQPIVIVPNVWNKYYSSLNYNRIIGYEDKKKKKHP